MSRQLMPALAACALISMPAAVARVRRRCEQSAPIVSQRRGEPGVRVQLREGTGIGADLLRGTSLTPARGGRGRGGVSAGTLGGRCRASRGCPTPWSLGPYTTYVLWAVAPDGRATNLGVLETSDGRGKLKTSYLRVAVRADRHGGTALRRDGAEHRAVVLINVAKRRQGRRDQGDVARRASRLLGPRAASPIDKKSAPAEPGCCALCGCDRGRCRCREVRGQRVTRRRRTSSRPPRPRRRARNPPSVATRRCCRARPCRRARTRAGPAWQAPLPQRPRSAGRPRPTWRPPRPRPTSARARRRWPRSPCRIGSHSCCRRARPSAGWCPSSAACSSRPARRTLTASARESLAKFAGVVASYPSLRYVVEGHTDNTGSEAKNRELSLKRAISVRDYLIGQGIAASSTDVAGLGSSSPVS